MMFRNKLQATSIYIYIPDPTECKVGTKSFMNVSRSTYSKV
uniref:Uncharacterized protein n=1 Tax=Arundo donax TaxID=35708 RepID=A0A0A8Y8U5_ARUDO